MTSTNICTTNRNLAAWLDEGCVRIYPQGPLPAWLVQAEQAWQRTQREELAALIDHDTVTSLVAEVRSNPQRVDLLYRTAEYLVILAEFARAIEVYRHIVALAPNEVAFFRLSELLHHQRKLSEALQWAQRAVELQPEQVWCWMRLGHCLCDVGRVAEGVLWLRRAETERPDDADLLEKRLGWEHYVPGKTRRDFLTNYQRLGSMLSKGPEAQTHFNNTPNPDRRLRVAVLSPFFYDNSIVYTFEPLLDGYDRQQLELIAYADQAPERGDETTGRLQTKFDRFHYIGDRSDAAVVELMQAEKIDILMQLGGYVRGHRLRLLSLRPAPVQIVFGSVDTTGLTQVDYRISDVWQDPLESELPYAEAQIDIPGGSQCYRPIAGPAQVTALPALTNGYVTFGAFHSHVKLNPEVFRLWAQVLQAVPQSRLLLKLAANADPGLTELVLEQCAAAGMDTRRIDVAGWLPHGDHLQLYSQVDLMLDTFPFTGAIMTLEALWMGVPTVTLAGDLLVHRMGTAIMQGLGLPDFIASTPDEYIRKAVDFTRQIETLAHIRQGLRQMMLSSDLCNAHRFGMAMTTALRCMWQRWCRTQGVDVPSMEPADMFGRCFRKEDKKLRGSEAWR